MAHPTTTAAAVAFPPPVIAVAEPPEECAVKPVGTLHPATADDFASALVGRWFLCTTPSIFATSDEIGLEFAADRRWRKLFGSIDSVKPGSGPGAEGTWSVYDTSAMNGPGYFDLLLEDDAGRRGGFPTISANGRRLRLRSYQDIDYVRV
jgi:hypothetical protein